MGETKLSMSKRELVQTALTAFCAFLTIRRETLMLGMKHEAPPVMDALKEFLETNHIEAAADLTPEHFEVWTETLV